MRRKPTERKRRMDSLVFVVVVCPTSRPPSPHRRRRVSVSVHKTWTLRGWRLGGESWRARVGACATCVGSVCKCGLYD